MLEQPLGGGVESRLERVEPHATRPTSRPSPALDAMVHVTRDTVPGFDHVSISVLHHDGTIETQAATTL